MKKNYKINRQYKDAFLPVFINSKAINKNKLRDS